MPDGMDFTEYESFYPQLTMSTTAVDYEEPKLEFSLGIAHDADYNYYQDCKLKAVDLDENFVPRGFEISNGYQCEEFDGEFVELDLSYGNNGALVASDG